MSELWDRWDEGMEDMNMVDRARVIYENPDILSAEAAGRALSVLQILPVNLLDRLCSFIFLPTKEALERVVWLSTLTSKRTPDRTL